MQASVITIEESDVQLHHLVQNIQNTSFPVLLKQKWNAFPIAFILPLPKQLTRQVTTRTTLVHHIEMLQAVTKAWQDQLLAEPDTEEELKSLYAPLIEDRLRTLAKFNRELNAGQRYKYSTFNSFVMLLRLGINDVTTSDQVQAFQSAIDILLTSNLTSKHIAEADTLLYNANIDARIDFGESDLVQQRNISDHKLIAQGWHDHGLFKDDPGALELFDEIERERDRHLVNKMSTE